MVPLEVTLKMNAGKPRKMKLGITRKPWADGEREFAWALRTKTSMKNSEIADALNNEFGRSRSETGMRSLFSKIEKGQREEPNIDGVDISDERLSKRKRTIDGRNTWNDRQSERLYDLTVTQGLSYLEATQRINTEFEGERTVKAIAIQYSKLKNMPDRRPASLRDKEFPTLGKGPRARGGVVQGNGYVGEIGLSLGRFDESRLKRVLSERIDLIYVAMKEQADVIRQHGVVAKHRGKSFDEIMRLPKEERAKLGNLFISGADNAEGEIDTIELLAVPYDAEGRLGTALIAPVFLQDVARTTGSLESCIDSAIVQVIMSKKAGFSKGIPFEDKFNSLRRYNVKTTMEADYDALAGSISDLVSSEYKGKNVVIARDEFLSGHQLKTD